MPCSAGSAKRQIFGGDVRPSVRRSGNRSNLSELMDEGVNTWQKTVSAQANQSTPLRLAGSNGVWWVPVVGLLTAMLCAPFFRSIFGLGDEGVLLHGADRILRGYRLYADFFELLPPGGFLITAAWFGIAGTSMGSAQVLAVLTIVGIACFTYLACRQASKHAPTSAVIALGWVVMSQGLWTQISHHWFTTLFSMAAAWATLVSVERPPRWLPGPLIAGLASGAAAMVTPTRGALVMLAAATAFADLRRVRSELIVYVLGGILVPTCLLAYVIEHGALAAAFDDVILFSATRYSSIQSVPFGHFASVQNLPLKYLFPVAAALMILTCVRDRRGFLRDRLLRSCAAFGLAGFVGCFPRPDIVHIAFAAPLVCPLLAYCLERLTRPWPPRSRSAAGAFVIALCIPSVVALSYITNLALSGEIVTTPRGRVTFPLGRNGDRELLARIAETPSGDAYLFYPYMPMLPFLTARSHVAKSDIFVPGYTLPSQYQEACISAIRRASWVVIDRNRTNPTFLKAIFPAMQDAQPQETKRFELALEHGFEFVSREGAFELRRRVKGSDETVCAGIEE